MSITQIYFQCEKKNGQILFREKPLETTYLCPSTLATDRYIPTYINVLNRNITRINPPPLYRDATVSR